jgi:hypothetical protein
MGAGSAPWGFLFRIFSLRYLCMVLSAWHMGVKTNMGD